jgi:hypothetical protein
MAATAATVTAHSGETEKQTTLHLKGSTKFGDFRDDLARDGYAVIKGAVPRDRAEKYGNNFYEYLENL